MLREAVTDPRGLFIFLTPFCDLSNGFGFPVSPTVIGL